MVYSVYQGKGGSLPFAKRKPKAARQSVKMSLTRSPRYKLPQSFRRSCSLNLDITNTASSKGFGVTGVFSKGIAFKFELSGFTVSSPTSTATASMVATDFQQMYDQYKIKAVRLKFYLSSNSFNSSSADKDPNPVFTIANDYVDNVPPTSDAELRQYDNHKDFQFNNNSLVQLVKPRIVNEVMGTSGTAQAVGQSANQWIQTSSLTVPHYGCKMWVNFIGMENNTTTLSKMLITATYYLEMKNTV